MTQTPPPATPKKPVPDARAAALRANLKRRKHPNPPTAKEPDTKEPGAWC